MKKGDFVKITKISDERFNNNHPNNINEGYIKIGFLLDDIKLFESIHIGCLRTSYVEEILDENTFRTHNSIYKVVPFNSDCRVLNNVDGINSSSLSPNKQLIIYNNASEWYGENNVEGIVELPDKIIINFGGCFSKYDFDSDFQNQFNLTDEQLDSLLKQV